MSLPLRILYVEDNEGDVTLFRVALTDSGTPHTIVIKTDGEQAVNYIAEVEANRQLPPDLILLDILLSGEDGGAICRRLKSDEKTRHIPVILLSAHAGLKDTMSSCGADDFLAKPFRVTELREIVKKYLSLSSVIPL